MIASNLCITSKLESFFLLVDRLRCLFSRIAQVNSYIAVNACEMIYRPPNNSIDEKEVLRQEEDCSVKLPKRSLLKSFSSFFRSARARSDPKVFYNYSSWIRDGYLIEAVPRHQHYCKTKDCENQIHVCRQVS